MADLDITFKSGAGEFLKMTETREAVQDTQPPGPRSISTSVTVFVYTAAFVHSFCLQYLLSVHIQ